MNDAVVYNLADAAQRRDAQVRKARSDFDKAVRRAAGIAAMQQRSASIQYENARKQAHKVALIRVQLWREHATLDIQELRTRLALHQFLLRPEYAQAQRAQRVPPAEVTAQVAADRWYVRMISAELRRRAAAEGQVAS